MPISSRRNTQYNMNPIINYDRLHEILKSFDKTRYINNIPALSFYHLKEIQDWDVNEGVVTGRESQNIITRNILYNLYKKIYHRGPNNELYIFQDVNGNYFLHNINCLYKIVYISFDNYRNLLSEFTLLSQEEFENIDLDLRTISHLSDGTHIYDVFSNLEFYENYYITHIRNEPVSSERFYSLNYDVSSQNCVVGNELRPVLTNSLSNEEIYTPTEEELKYPDVYVQRHKFNCKSINPMIVGEWAVNFNKIITNKLKRLGFE